jgi:hypothetical protein
LVAVDPEGSLEAVPSGKTVSRCPVKTIGRLLPLLAGMRAAMQLPKIHSESFAGNAGSFEKSPQPIADGIDAAFVVTTRVDIHEVGQYADHRLMLPAEMLENSGSCVDAHA